MTLKVRLAISDVPLRQTLCDLLDQAPELVVLPSTSSSEQVGADLLLVDGEAHAADAYELIRSARRTNPHSRAIMLVAEPTSESVQAALSAGASGVVAKSQPPREVLGAVRVVAQGGSYVCLSATSDPESSTR